MLTVLFLSCMQLVLALQKLELDVRRREDRVHSLDEEIEAMQRGKSELQSEYDQLRESLSQGERAVAADDAAQALRVRQLESALHSLEVEKVCIHTLCMCMVFCLLSALFVVRLRWLPMWSGCSASCLSPRQSPNAAHRHRTHSTLTATT